MTVEGMSHFPYPYDHTHLQAPMAPNMAPNVFPPGSAVDYLGALAQQYECQQQQQNMYHMYYQQQQYHQQQLLMFQQQMFQQQQHLAAPQRDANGFQCSVQHQQLQWQKQMHLNQSGLLSPTIANVSPIVSTLSSSASSSKTKSSKSAVKSTVKQTTPPSSSPVVTKSTPGLELSETQPQKRRRINFHSIADLVSTVERTVTTDVSDVIAVSAVPVSAAAALAEATAGDQNRKRTRSLCSLGSSPGNLVIDEDRCPEFSPTLTSRARITCGSSSDLSGHVLDLPGPSREPSPGSGSRTVSPALSFISSVRDTDTPCSSVSSDGFTTSTPNVANVQKGCSDDESKRKSRRLFQVPQIQILEQVFAQCQYPEPAFVERLARDLDTTDGKIRVWFQNKRARWRKRSHEENQSKPSPWLPGTPLYQPSNQPSSLPVSMPMQQQLPSPGGRVVMSTSPPNNLVLPAQHSFAMMHQNGYQGRMQTLNYGFETMQ